MPPRPHRPRFQAPDFSEIFNLHLRDDTHLTLVVPCPPSPVALADNVLRFILQRCLSMGFKQPTATPPAQVALGAVTAHEGCASHSAGPHHRCLWCPCGTQRLGRRAGLRERRGGRNERKGRHLRGSPRPAGRSGGQGVPGPPPIFTCTVGCALASLCHFCTNHCPQAQRWKEPPTAPRGTAAVPVTVPFLRGHHNRGLHGRWRLGTPGLLPQEGLAHGYQRLLRTHHAHVQEAADEEAGEAEQQELPAAAGGPAATDSVSEAPCARGRAGSRTSVLRP